MKVLDQLVFVGSLYGVPRAEAARRARDWLTRFRIPDYADRRAEQLSKGNQQKVQFIGAILHDPDVLLMDEPFTGLDPINVALLKEAFLELRDRGKAIVFSTHQMEAVEELCDAIAIIDRGRVVVSGPTPDVKRQAGRLRRPPGRGGRSATSPGSTPARRNRPSVGPRLPRDRAPNGHRPGDDPPGGARPTRVRDPLRDRRALDRGHLHRAASG